MRQILCDDLIRANLMEDARLASIKYNVLNEPAILSVLSGKSIDKKIQDILEDFPGVFSCESDTVIAHFFKSAAETQTLPPDENHRDSVLCIIKPHILHTNTTGDLLGQIYRQGFVVVNIKLTHLDRSQCEEFLRVYQGVLPEFIQISLQLASGPMIAMELTNGTQDDDQDVHTKFRNLCGPYDSVC